MLEEMSYRQYFEWLAFFKIRNEDRPRAGTGTLQRGKYGNSAEGQKRLSADAVRAFQGYQRRMDARKR